MTEQPQFRLRRVTWPMGGSRVDIVDAQGRVVQSGVHDPDADNDWADERYARILVERLNAQARAGY